MSSRAGSWYQTASGAQFWPLDPRPDEVSIEDIAAHLSKLCRFGGATQNFYSVGQHCVLVSQIVPVEDALWGLLHDAAEAYAQDLVRPIKRHLPAYVEVEEHIQRTICDRFGLPHAMPESVRLADDVLLATEKRDLMRPEPAPWGPLPEPLPEKIRPWSDHKAEWLYLVRFKELTRGS